jgi:uncharacterized protein YjbI with pentapeptide repeats
MRTSKKHRDVGEFAIIAPDLTPMESARTIARSELLPDSTFEDVVLDKTDLQAKRQPNMRFSGVRFFHVRGASSSLHNLKLLDAFHDSCDWANASWDRASVARCILMECRMTGFGAANASFENTSFRKCKIDMAVFQSTEFKACSFEDCLLHDSSFEEAVLRSVRFRGCDLRNVRMARAQLEDVDLRGCVVEGLQFELPDARGLTIDPSQAPELIRLLGVKVQNLSQPGDGCPPSWKPA